MMRARVLTIAIAIVLAAMPLRAQTGLADGVDALMHGDYARAAAILKPLAESPWQADPKAAFFMAMLYGNGLGVSPDPLRECAMVIRAGNDRDTPIGAAASMMVPGRQRALGRDEFQTCTWRASVGFDDRFQPATFVLEPDHWFTWELRSSAIWYRGAETRRNVAFALGPFRFVAMRHTELATGDTRSIRRHFVDAFKWLPMAQPRTWTLDWSLIEIVGDQTVSIASERLMTFSGEEPPGTEALDLDALAHLRVTDEGDAQVSMVVAGLPKTKIIESERDRQMWKALVEQQKRVDAPVARADAARVLDAHRRPSLSYAAADAAGCGNAFVYAWTSDRREALSVRASVESLQISSARTFDLAAPPPGLDVRVHVYDRAGARQLCTDVGVGPLVEEEWRAVAGAVTIEVEPRQRATGLYRATIRLSGAEFVGSNGVRVSMPQPVTLTAIVGRGF